TLAGTVTEKETGKPVEGATVRATSWESDEGHAAEGVTDAEGRYAMELTVGPVNEIAVEKEGLVQIRLDRTQGTQRHGVVHDGQRTVQDVQMRRGVRLSGVVRGPDGPLAGARVVVAVGEADDVSQRPTTTGPDGRYVFEGIDKGTRLVVAEKQG